MDPLDRVYVTGSAKQFVTPSQVQETCSISTFTGVHFRNIPPVTTGLDIIWDADGLPDMIFFGCSAEVNSFGNFSTAFRDGKVIQTISGAYTGSILFGMDLPEMTSDLVNHDSEWAAPPLNTPNSSLGRISLWDVLFWVLVTGIAASLYVLRKAFAQRHIVHVYSRIYDIDGAASADIQGLELGFDKTTGALEIEPISRSSYAELTDTDNTNTQSQDTDDYLT